MKNYFVTLRPKNQPHRENVGCYCPVMPSAAEAIAYAGSQSGFSFWDVEKIEIL